MDVHPAAVVVALAVAIPVAIVITLVLMAKAARANHMADRWKRFCQR